MQETHLINAWRSHTAILNLVCDVNTHIMCQIKNIILINVFALIFVTVNETF